MYGCCCRCLPAWCAVRTRLALDVPGCSWTVLPPPSIHSCGWLCYHTGSIPPTVCPHYSSAKKGHNRYSSAMLSCCTPASSLRLRSRSCSWGCMPAVLFWACMSSLALTAAPSNPASYKKEGTASRTCLVNFGLLSARCTGRLQPVAMAWRCNRIMLVMLTTECNCAVLSSACRLYALARD